MILVLGHLLNFISYQSPYHWIHSGDTASLLFLKHLKHTTPSRSLHCLKHSPLNKPRSSHSPTLCRSLLKCCPSLLSSHTSKIAHSTFSTPLSAFSSNHLSLSNIIKLLILFIFSTKLQAQKGQRICLLCSTPLYKTTVPSTSCSISI